MKLQHVLFLMLLAIDSSISNGLDGSTQQEWSCGQIILTGDYTSTTGRYRYRQQFFATSNNQTIFIEMNPPTFSTRFQCEICSNDSCTSDIACQDYLRQIWLNYKCNCLPAKISTASPLRVPTTTAGPFASTNYIPVSVATFCVMAALQIVLLAIVITGWAWTCWIVKKRDMNSNTHITERKRCCFNNCHSDNEVHSHDSNTSEKDIAATGFLQMTNYSLLYPDGATRARNGEMSVEGEDKRCAYTLGRSKWPKKHQKIPEGYSKLSYNTG